MAAKDHYAKILLSKQQLIDVYKQLKRALETKLLLHLPNCSTHDPYRIEVENVLNEHLTDVLNSTKDALIVDGIDLGEHNISIEEILALESHVEVAPYDPSLNLKLRLVLQEVETQTTKVTRLRRELPLQAKDAYEHLISTADQELKSYVEELDLPVPPSYTLNPQSEESKSLGESIINLCEIRKSLPLQESKIRAFNQVVEFLGKVYEDRSVNP